MDNDAHKTYPGHQWFEDFQAGQVFEYGAWVMSRDDMLAFARKYDPEPFHVDEAEAVRLGWGGLIASGPQVMSICRRLQKDGFPKAQIVISPGWDEIRWFKPVYAGDRLSCRSQVLETRVLTSRPGEGAVRMRNAILNQKGDVVAQMISTWFVRQR